MATHVGTSGLVKVGGTTVGEVIGLDLLVEDDLLDKDFYSKILAISSIPLIFLESRRMPRFKWLSVI